MRPRGRRGLPRLLCSAVQCGAAAVNESFVSPFIDLASQPRPTGNENGTRSLIPIRPTQIGRELRVGAARAAPISISLLYFAVPPRRALPVHVHRSAILLPSTFFFPPFLLSFLPFAFDGAPPPPPRQISFSSEFAARKKRDRRKRRIFIFITAHSLFPFPLTVAARARSSTTASPRGERERGVRAGRTRVASRLALPNQSKLDVISRHFS